MRALEEPSGANAVYFRNSPSVPSSAKAEAGIATAAPRAARRPSEYAPTPASTASITTARMAEAAAAGSSWIMGSDNDGAARSSRCTAPVVVHVALVLGLATAVVLLVSRNRALVVELEGFAPPTK